MANYRYFEAIRDVCANISENLKTSVYGKVYVHYDNYADSLHVTIKNRAFNGNEFEMDHANFSREIRLGTPANVLANFILKEYRDYINMYFYRKW